MADIDFKGVRAAYRTLGKGPPLLLLHSGGGSGAQWDRIAKALAADRLSIAPDLLGFGATGAWPEAGALTHDLQAELAARVVEEITDQPVDIVGHSYGGATAIRLTMNHRQKIRSLVLIEPILSNLLREAGDPLFPGSVAVAQAFIESVEKGQPELGWQAFLDGRNGTGTWTRITDAQRQQFLARSDSAREAFISNLADRTSLADCRSIDVPTTVVCGATTSAPDRRTTELLKDAVAGARHVVIEGAAHMSPLTHPNETVTIIREHLGRTQAG